MTDPDIASVSDLLDDWRHLPAYQVERRADIFFALFLINARNRHLRRRADLGANERNDAIKDAVDAWLKHEDDLVHLRRQQVAGTLTRN